MNIVIQRDNIILKCIFNTLKKYKSVFVKYSIIKINKSTFWYGERLWFFSVTLPKNVQINYI